MESVKELFEGTSGQIILSSIFFAGTLIVIFIVYRFVLRKLQIYTLKTKNRIDDFVVELLRLPILFLLFWITFMVYSHYSFLSRTSFYHTLTELNDVLLIITIGWILIKLVRVLFYYLEHKAEANDPTSLRSREDLTKMKIFEGLTVAILAVITVGIALMTFDRVRTIGVSLLTSAGIAGIIIGFAAQKSIGTLFSGIQLALTQPIRLEDEVIVEGQSGKIEEIDLTYVIVKLWDEKRLILPVNYFLENSFQNLTRTSGNILGTAFLYLDYSVPIDVLRNHLSELIINHPKWDKRVSALQVTDTRDNYMEIRILLSSTSSGTNFDLMADIREKMLRFINEKYPGCFVKTRVVGSLDQSVKK